MQHQQPYLTLETGEPRPLDATNTSWGWRGTAFKMQPRSSATISSPT